MRAYLAIIKDSFREAMASRVLWLLLIAITLFLLVVAPLGIKQKLTTRFVGIEVRDPPGFVSFLKSESLKSDATLAKQVWLLIDEEERTELERALAALEKAAQEKTDPGEEYLRIVTGLRDALNGVLTSKNIYSTETWNNVALTDETQELLDKGYESLDDEQRLRMNRLLLEAAFPNHFFPQPEKSLVGSYLFWESGAFPIQQASARAFIEEYVLSYFLSIVVGSGGILVAILVTASIIPQMFDPGSLHLLLSKPVNRTLLFLSKFLGGCAFTLLNVGYLLVGIWLILGVRFGIWNVGVLYCIPIFLFVFSIYYAVSALASVIWRNAIVSVMITIVFWGLCFGVGFLKVNILDFLYIKPNRIVKLIPASDTLISVDEFGKVMIWSEDEQDWRQVFHGQDRGNQATPIYMGPLYDAKHQQLVGVNTVKVFTSEIPVQLAIGKPGEGWRRKPSVGMPGGALEMFVEPEKNRKQADKDQPGILVVSTNGIFRFADVAPRKILGVEVGFGSGPQFVNVSADPELFFNTPAAAALNAETGELAVYSRGTVQIFAANADGKYAVKMRNSLEIDEDQGAILAFSGSTLIVAGEDGTVRVLDPKSLAEDAELRGERRSQPRFVSAAPGGKHVAIVYQNGKLWIYDKEAGGLRRASVSGQGDIYAATFKSANRLLVADRTNRVSEYAADTGKLQSRLTPSLSTLEQVYWYAVKPLYFVFPRPGEFGYTMQYALTGKESSSSFSVNMQAARDSLNPWRPVWNGLVFMFVILGLACVYIERQEF